MAYRKTNRKSSARRGNGGRAGARGRGRATVRSGGRRSSQPHVVKIVIEHSMSNGDASTGGLMNPQVQTQTKKARF